MRIAEHPRRIGDEQLAKFHCLGGAVGEGVKAPQGPAATVHQVLGQDPVLDRDVRAEVVVQGGHLADEVAGDGPVLPGFTERPRRGG
jgi:hypothetical protein